MDQKSQNSFEPIGRLQSGTWRLPFRQKEPVANFVDTGVWEAGERSTDRTARFDG